MIYSIFKNNRGAEYGVIGFFDFAVFAEEWGAAVMIDMCGYADETVLKGI
jgi:hypothetical protein